MPESRYRRAGGKAIEHGNRGQISKRMDGRRGDQRIAKACRVHEAQYRFVSARPGSELARRK